MKFCTCQMVSRNVFDCAMHGEMMRASSAKYQAEQTQREAAAAARREGSK